MRPRFSRLQAVALAHFVIDIFNSMGPVVLTFLSAHLMTLSKTQIGLAASLYALLHGFSQPVFGWIADRSGGRVLSAVGIVWTTGLLLTAFIVGAATQNYALMLMFYAIAPLGSAAFHPIGTMHASATERNAGRLSWFFLAGFMGAAVGPTLTGALLDSTLPGGALASLSGGAEGSVIPLLALTILIVPAALALMLSLPNRAAFKDGAQESADPTGTRLPKRALALLALVILIRSLTNPGVVPFLPSIFQAKGWSAAEYGSVTSVYWVAGAIAGVVSGNLADRFGNRALITLTMLLSAPTYWLLPGMDGPAVMLVALLMGGLSGASHSIIVAEGQRMMPARKGLASGAVLGFIFASGALGNFLIGVLSDAFGLIVAFEVAAVTVVVAALLGWFVLERKDAPDPAVLAPAPDVGVS